MYCNKSTVHVNEVTNLWLNLCCFKSVCISYDVLYGWTSLQLSSAIYCIIHSIIKPVHY